MASPALSTHLPIPASRKQVSVRSEYWDGWKAVCITVVIALHVMQQPDIFVVGSWGWSGAVILPQFILFPVAIFFAIAGFFALGRPADSRFENARDYYQRRLKRIIPPYLIWTAAFILLEHRHDLSSIRELSKDVMLGTGIGIGYFVIVLIQYILLTPFLARLSDKRTHIVLMAILFACGLLVTYVARVGHPNSKLAQFPFYCLSFVVWYPFYHLGLFAAKFGIADSSSLWRSRAWIFLLYFVSLAASMAEGIFFCGRGVSLGESQLKATSLLTSLALFLLLLCYHRSGPGRILSNRSIQLLGKSSFMIYLMHLLVLHRSEILLCRIAVIHQHESLYMLSSLLLTLLLCGIAASLAAKLPPNFGKLLGA